jgi:CRISPR-associated protein Cmr5
MTRQQQMMTWAIGHVNAVKNLNDEHLRTCYGNLCHKFPVLIRTCGLCQTAAFIQHKGNPDSNQADGDGQERDSRARANQLLGEHALEILRHYGITGEGQLADVVSGLDRTQYMLATRLLLDSWIYYKRFAESVLDVKAGDSNG